ncbi:peptidase M15 [Caenimonas sedimenti]|uniref:Peptidase M15 n=1 Tax=Caenimonas sedimenti TaxID=2596921 RepID=A0A562ZNE3_9BURK|nr:D-Ala-D-Ala carboxypeptidase family metallohydrolase [Caenimonas sedimenti]TWO69838.1 peptidase M15 [Caenimonas sedimenti]
MRRGIGVLLFLIAWLGGNAARAQADERDATQFAQWRLSRQAQVEAFQTFLDQENLAHVSPLHELLRSASMWKECKAEPFQIPPAAQWSEVRKVLQLLVTLRERKLLDRIEVVSGYRDEALNRCAGGSPRSAHRRSFAVDLAPLSRAQGLALCRFWRDQGEPLDMGLSRYPTGRVHIDRAGYRTWGEDHTRLTSFCNLEAAPHR